MPSCSDDAHEADDAYEEAAALLKFVEQRNCDPREIRELIDYTDTEKRCLESLAAQGMLASAQLAEVLSFRDSVLEQFNNLIDAEMLALSETNKPASDGAVESNSEVVEVQAHGPEMIDAPIRNP